MLSLHFAQVGLKTYRKVDILDRREEPDHPAARALASPNVDTPPARFFRETAVQYFIYGNAYWYIVTADGRRQLLLIPSGRVTPRGGSITLATEYVIERPGIAQPLIVPKAQIVHFKDDPDPEDPRIGVSRLAALRADINEAVAASDHMRKFWENAAQMPVVVERPLAAPEWSDDARKRFEASWANRYAGKENAGKTGVLEEGMTAKELGISPQAAQLMEARTFGLEAVARSFGMPVALLGLGEQTGYGSTVEAHSALYQDTLGPHFRVFEDEINLQFLQLFPDVEGLYVEFNIAEKLQGRFDEQAAALSTAVGGPWMVADEARARVNLPQMGGAAGELQTVPGAGSLGSAPAEPADAAATATAAGRIDAKAVPGSVIRRRRTQASAYEAALVTFFERQSKTVMSKLGAKAAVDDAFDSARWDKELSSVLRKLNGDIAVGAGKRTAREIGGKFERARIVNFLSDHAEGEARRINAATKDALALEDADAAHIFDVAKTARAAGAALTAVTRYNAFGRHEAARQNGRSVKTWIVTSAKSRHPEMDGQRVTIDHPFSNGGMWPGDPALGTEEVAGCECVLDI